MRKRLWRSRTIVANGILAGILVLDKIHGSGLITDPASLKGLLLGSAILNGLLRLDTSEAVSVFKPAGDGATSEAIETS